jgi:POT family proton-dependent oligopeptide transporter
VASSSEVKFLGHPIGLSVLFGTEMWERFCYYGMRALLTFYMVDFLFAAGAQPARILGYGLVKSGLEWVYGPLAPQPLAALIYGLYAAFTYFTGVIGGTLADQLTGQKIAVIIGASTMAVGEFLLMDPSLFFVGLLVLVAGNGFFKPNITTQVGGLYAPGDPRIDRAYSVFYVGINLGAMIAPPICGRLGHAAPGQPPHWQYGFAAAGVGMLIGLCIFLIGLSRLPPDMRGRRKRAEQASGITAQLTPQDRQAVIALILIAFCNLFFWGCYEQQGITVALMAQNHTDLSTWFGTLAPEDVQSFNPFFIFTLTPAIIAFWGWQARRGAEPSPVTKMAIGCAAMALCFALLMVPAMAVDGGQKVSVLWLVAAMALLTVGELYLAPVGLSLFSRAAPAKLASLMMAVNYLSNFAGNYLAGYLGHVWAGMHKAAFFGMIAAIGAGASVAIFALSFVLNPILNRRA